LESIGKGFLPEEIGDARMAARPAFGPGSGRGCGGAAGCPPLPRTRIPGRIDDRGRAA
jgi:hypothetical protein